MTRVILAVSERRRWMEDLEAQLRPDAFQIHVAAPGSGEPDVVEPDLILLDLPGPEQNALADYRCLLQLRSTPLVLLTALSTDAVVAEALEAGADCCLPASISPRELAAWVQALLRRRALPALAQTAPLTLGSLTIDLERGRIQKQGAELLLPPTQLLLLRALAERPGQVVPREHLLAQVLGTQPRRKMSTLHVHMFQLRTVIEDNPSRPRYLKTIRGVGYVLSGDSEGGARAGAREAGGGHGG